MRFTRANIITIPKNMRRATVILKNKGPPALGKPGDGDVKNKNDYLLIPMIVFTSIMAGSVLGLNWYMASESERIHLKAKAEHGKH